MNGQIGIKQIIQGFIGLLLLIIFVWLAFYALIIVLLIAACVTAFFVTRKYLIQFGMLKQAEAPYSADQDSTPNSAIIETEYQDVTEETKDDTR